MLFFFFLIVLLYDVLDSTNKTTVFMLKSVYYKA